MSGLSLLVVGVVLATQTATLVVVSADARAMQPGELVQLTMTTATPADALRVRAFDRDLVPYRIDSTTWRVLVGIDLDVVPGTYTVSIDNGLSPGATTTHAITVTAKDFPTRRLTVDTAYVNPPASVLARIAEEARELTRLWASSAAARLWAEAFVRPVPQPSNSAFGTRSILNGTPRSPHGGADFASPAGTPIQAPAAGRVVLAKPLYYTGNTVAVDHGVGLVSLFAHLSTVAVREGEAVTAGTVLGKVGATGRVTGAHLHWTVRAGGARVDPLSLLALLGSR